MLVWWAATSFAVPLGMSASTPYEADGPAPHEVSLQPVPHQRATHDFERATKKCTWEDQQHGVYPGDGKPCCEFWLYSGVCEDHTYASTGGNCHLLWYVDPDKGWADKNLNKGATDAPTPPACATA